jgi:hypothetical protein
MEFIDGECHMWFRYDLRDTSFGITFPDDNCLLATVLETLKFARVRHQLQMPTFGKSGRNDARSS